jgi:hypothetical protein
MARRVITCAECGDFPYGMLKEHLSTDAIAAKNTEVSRNGMEIGRSRE